ncbi:dTDP-4-dehydrorhamnose reductase [Pseudobacteriovorax antillogorgiicola]|uniref:dTDP-4-dehydrorhamnose reductase n=1 Tax=Pseudobacteriovorax antillogorgiicola TaxID=1513793 RepID=A0A1Y6CJ11_9BACT|nr:dTDP-4-dehydrorhamnose reductase [Pseudobacteriovorax antillogorgiicola]TCS46743.1 dTDP-4-dehydrorhamnose reductase [Pseudobacteriovorax antillogorgiicola]SMF67522.1 dTDP-4-dehydrorhamnose reductase [Pseudobacteriovorax antillogorgiicola]
MKCLILGADGQVGFELCQQLSDSSYEIITTALEPEQGSRHQALDLSKQEQIFSFLSEVKPDLILNAAAYTAVDKAEEEQALAMAVNAHAVRALAGYAAETNALLVHYSTDYIFDGSGEKPRKESEPAKPVNWYGKTKWIGEQAVRESGCRHLIFRTSWVYGFHGHNFVKTMLRVGSSRKELNVVADQIGSPTSAFQIAEATIQAIAQVLEDLNKQNLAGTYHLTAKGFTSWANFAQEIFRQASRFDSGFGDVTVNDIPSKDYPTPAARPLNSRLDCSKLEGAFSYSRDNWQDQLALVVERIFSS